MTSASDQLMIFSAAAGGLWLLNTIHALIVEPKDDMANIPSFRIAYDPQTNGGQMRWEFYF